MNKTLVSVVIPSYNCRPFIGEAIDSALAQAAPTLAVEVIVVDDGSTDDSPALLRRYGQQITTVFQDNQGASAARDRGTRLARGDCIQYLDADDLLCPGTLAARLARMAADDADVVYSDWQKVSIDGEPLPGGMVARTLETVHPDPEIAIFTSFWAPPAAVLYRRRIVERIAGWHPDLPVIQDARFLFDAAHAGARFARCPGVGARYRLRDKHSLSRRNPLAFYRDVYRNAIEVEALWQDRLDELRRRALTEVFGFACRGLLGRPGGNAAFEDCVARIRRLGIATPLSWPRVAAALSPYLGADLTASALRMIGRPPE